NFDNRDASRGVSGAGLGVTPAADAGTGTVSAVRASRGGAGGVASPPPSSTRQSDGRAHVSELATESPRIERLSSIREVVFGAQDGLVSTFAVVAGLAAAGVGTLVVLLGGMVSAVAGVLSMSIGTFLASRAQRQLYETELERERREIREHPGEDIAQRGAASCRRARCRAPSRWPRCSWSASSRRGWPVSPRSARAWRSPCWRRPPVGSASVSGASPRSSSASTFVDRARPAGGGRRRAGLRAA